jgi:hypothetical protein
MTGFDGLQGGQQLAGREPSLHDRDRINVVRLTARTERGVAVKGRKGAQSESRKGREGVPGIENLP